MTTKHDWLLRSRHSRITKHLSRSNGILLVAVFASVLRLQMARAEGACDYIPPRDVEIKKCDQVVDPEHQLDCITRATAAIKVDGARTESSRRSRVVEQLGWAISQSGALC
jgi:hypothetical protein